MGAEFLEGGAGEGTASEEGQEVIESLPVGPPGVLGRDGVEDERFEAGDELARAAAGGCLLPFGAAFGTWNEVGCRPALNLRTRPASGSGLRA